MKRFLLVVVVVAVVSAYGFAQAKAGEIGIQGGSTVFTTTSLGPAEAVGVKVVVADNIALRADLGLESFAFGGSTETLLDAAAAVEFHFGGKGGVSPYAGGEVSYSTGTFTGLPTPYSTFGVAGLIGGEYFFSSNFSWAGEARLGFISESNPTMTILGTFGFASFLTWYLN